VLSYTRTLASPLRADAAMAKLTKAFEGSRIAVVRRDGPLKMPNGTHEWVAVDFGPLDKGESYSPAEGDADPGRDEFERLKADVLQRLAECGLSAELMPDDGY
jgi:hypothetical protein